MKGLSFSEPMVRAWMEGRKTVTRRLMNPQPVFDDSGVWYPRANAGKAFHYASESHFCKGVAIDFARYCPGETVYIKETWTRTADRAGRILYKADDGHIKAVADYPVKWKSPLFMPEWAARCHALIVSVRPERVQEITEEEAIAEGIAGIHPCNHSMDYVFGCRDQFTNLWESLHPGSWERNDWVWRIELEKIP